MNAGNGKLILALPSKGRLMDQTNAALAAVEVVHEEHLRSVRLAVEQTALAVDLQALNVHVR